MKTLCRLLPSFARLLFPGQRRSRGQSLLEFALFLPIMLMLVGGLVELSFGINRYINMVEAAREGARYGSDGQPDPRLDGRELVSGLSNMDCTTTRDFYAKIACVVQQSAEPIPLDAATDDIVITVARIYRSPLCDEPSPPVGLDCTARIMPDPDGLWPDPAGDPAAGEISGQWRWTGAASSQFDRASLQAYIDSNALSSGVLVVEVFYNYQLVLNLPWIQPFIDPRGDGIRFYTYTIIPVPAGEPRATPTPTPTPTNTPTPTYTPSPTNTPGPTATFTPPTPTETETPTATPLPPASATPVCRSGYVSSTKSSVSFVTGQTWPDYGWADNGSSLRLQVLLVSECDEALTGREVTIRPERDTTDTAVFEQAIGNQYLFTVRSSSIGQGLFYAVTELCPGDDPLCAVSPDTTQVTIAPPRGNFVCVLGTRDVSTSANTLQVMYNNPSPSGTFAWPPYMTRRLVRLVVEFPTASPALLIQSISFGSSANVIWAGGPVAGPSASFGDGTSLLWTSLNRSIISPFRPLQITFNQPITPASGSWTYRVTTIWDDALFGPTCTSAPVTITLP